MDDFSAHSDIKWNGHVGTVQYGGGDTTMIVLFYLKPVHNPARSVDTNSPQYDDTIYVRIHPPGERLNIIDRRATDADRKRFPMQWAQYQQNRPQVSNGTPIDMLFPANPSVAAALKASGVHTVEQCGALSAHAIESIGMGAQQWVNDANRYLEVANKGVKASQMKAALDEKDREIHSLNHKLDLVMAELNHIKDRNMETVTMDDVQAMIANQGGARGARAQYAPGKQLAPVFDAASAQIAASHPTADLAKRMKKSKAVTHVVYDENTPPKRQRARITSK